MTPQEKRVLAVVATYANELREKLAVDEHAARFEGAPWERFKTTFDMIKALQELQRRLVRASRTEEKAGKA